MGKKTAIHLALIILVCGVLFLVIDEYWGGSEEKAENYAQSGMTISSDAFKDGGLIPAKYTCDGESISPSLTFTEVPAGARSLAIIVEDPDVPKSIRPDRTWTHWLVWDIPTDISVVGEGNTPAGIVGKNSSGKREYGAPCPPDKEHRYYFRLFALDTELTLDPELVDMVSLEKAMAGHVLAQAQLMGRYDRPR
jgi:Raf kinase inhibitor-like YbhB/YbcL family protein